jgi:hypothetical protein
MLQLAQHHLSQNKLFVMEPVQISGFTAILFLVICFVLPALGVLLHSGKLTLLTEEEKKSCIHSTRACVAYSRGILFSGGGVPLWKVYFFKEHLAIVLLGVHRIYYSDLTSLKIRSAKLVSLKLEKGPKIRMLLMQPIKTNLTKFNFYHLLNEE